MCTRWHVKRMILCSSSNVTIKIRIEVHPCTNLCNKIVLWFKVALSHSNQSSYRNYIERVWSKLFTNQTWHWSVLNDTVYNSIQNIITISRNVSLFENYEHSKNNMNKMDPSYIVLTHHRKLNVQNVYI